jgi:hypothetical protein
MIEKLAMSDGVDNKEGEAISWKERKQITEKCSSFKKTPAERLGHGK